GLLGERREQRELERREVELDVAAPDDVGPPVDDEVGDVDRAARGTAGAAKEGLHPRHQLRHGEGLDQVVVGAHAEPGEAILYLAGGGAEEDGNAAAAAQGAPDGEAVDAV